MHGMRPFGALLPVEEALARLLGAVAPVSRVEELPLAAARGRVAAEDVVAPMAVPPFARATMDGYALRLADAAGPLRIVGDALAGHPFAGRVGPGQAVRIATGAPLPEGADCVVKVEETAEKDSHVTLRAAPRPGQNVDGAGSDVPLGARVVAAGEPLTPARLGLLASVGLPRVRVRAAPRVALLTSGDEVRPPGEPLPPGAIHDANGATLRALFEQAGAAVEPSPPLRDELDALRAALRRLAAAHDLVVLTGGASVGSRDLVADAVRAEGEMLFHGVRVRPGKPLLAGRVGSALVVGLPGNPTSALSNAHLFLLPVLRRLQGLPEAASPVVEAILASEVRGEPDRYLFLPVRLEGDRAVPTFKGSGALTSLSASDGWVGVPEGARLQAGERVRVSRW